MDMNEDTGDFYIMKGKKLKRGLALVLGLMLAAEVPASVATPFQMFDSYAYTGAATVKATSLNVRSGAGTGYSSVGRLAAGAAVTVIGEQRGTDGNTWYQIQYTGTGGAVNTGYVSSVYIRLPVAYTKDSNFEAYLTSQGFPESYKNGLRQLHAQYPNWVFKAKNTGLDWNTVIENESVLGRNLVATGSVSSWKSVANGAYNWDNSTWTGFDGSNWVAASEDIIRYNMDPRNFLDETYVFQFLNHEYDANTQTKEGLNSLISGSFLSGTTNSTGTGGSDFSSGPGSSTGGSGSGGPGSSGSSSADTLMVHCLHFHLVCKCLFTWKDMFSLQITVYHCPNGIIITHFPNDDRNLRQACKHSGMFSSVPGYNLISSFFRRTHQQSS